MHRHAVTRRPIVNISPPGRIPGEADLRLDEFTVHAEGGSGGGNNVFLEHHGPKIVGAEAQGDLPNRWALRNPGTLQMGNIVEEQPGEGLNAEVLGSRRVA